MTASKSVQPLSPPEFDALMDGIGFFESSPTLAVALSGGADSMALALLAHGWTQRRGGRIVALTVDHGLRAESVAEAEHLQRWCTQAGIEHHTLCWQHEDGLPASAIQARARDARYRLMTGWCRAHHVLHLLTAHHRDDQAETLFFRLARGSGLEGLSGMAAKRVLSGVRLLRPLLSIPKGRLEASLRAQGQPWLDDPSNQNPRYSRTLLRGQFSSLADEQGMKARISHMAYRLGIFRNLLEYQLAIQLTHNVSLFPEAYGVITLDRFLALPNGLALHALSALAQTLSGTPYPPRSEKLERLYAHIGSRTHSIGGLLFEPVAQKNRILVYREASAVEQPVSLPSDTRHLWDNRFYVTWQARTPGTLTLRTLGPDGLAQVKARAPDLLRHAPPARILHTLPSLWRLEECVSAPHIGYMQAPAIACHAHFHPAKPLAGSGFFVMNSQHPSKENAIRA